MATKEDRQRERKEDNAATQIVLSQWQSTGIRAQVNFLYVVDPITYYVIAKHALRRDSSHLFLLNYNCVERKKCDLHSRYADF